MTTNQTQTAEFVRGFFKFLESKQVRSATLHGGEDGFARELSDVDFVVAHENFQKLPALIDEYCTKVGWLLCQVLRHETTAAYYVCSATDDPSCTVALDACSDYQRNGTVFLSEKMLLENRQPLTWGGYGLSAGNELLYRFAKAAAKNKDETKTAEEFARYPEEIRRDCTEWLKTHWDISPQSWNATDLAPALAQLRAKSNTRPSLTQSGSLRRIASRIQHPTGLIVIVGREDFEAIATRIEKVFGHLYFRRLLKAARWQPSLLRELVASTLIILPEISALWAKLIPADCIHRLDPTQIIDSQCRDLAKHLHQRCMQRETQ
ncbi:MAG: hypothetical protein ACK49N_06105 [Verrucomicrobiota bacterium]